MFALGRHESPAILITSGSTRPSVVIAGLDPAIHAAMASALTAEDWIAGSSPAMTM